MEQRSLADSGMLADEKERADQTLNSRLIADIDEDMTLNSMQD
jgi:hypothetical protein